MLDRRINPFHELYVTETISPEDFVQLFSPHLVRRTIALFLPGNIVVKGVQGSGKSMLLGLIRPEVRVAYERAGERFPVPSQHLKFIGAGINIKRSGATDFGQRSFPDQVESGDEVLPVYFGDFFNYYIVSDVIRSLEFLLTKLRSPQEVLGVEASKGLLDEFARNLASHDCWFGYLTGVTRVWTHSIAQ